MAKRYASQADAPAKLVAKVKNGGGGVWGQMGAPASEPERRRHPRYMIGWVLITSKEPLTKQQWRRSAA